MGFGTSDDGLPFTRVHWAATVTALLGLGACRSVETVRPIPPVSGGKVRVRVFTEPSPVKSVTTVGKLVFVATASHVERWGENDSVMPLSAVSGEQIIAIASDEAKGQVWILSNRGVGAYDAASERYRDVLVVPAFVDFEMDGASIAAADDGVWIGHRHGLVHVAEDGTWTPTPLVDEISALARDRNGWVWAATADGLMVRKANGVVERIGAVHGNGVDAPRILVELPNDQLLAIGTDESGQELIAIGRDVNWKTYRALPDVHWDAAARRGEGAVVMGDGRIFTITPEQPNRVKPLSRDGMRLVPLTSSRSEWSIDPLDVQTPTGAITLGAAGDSLLIGTKDLGTARFRDGSLDWLRRRPMFQDATRLSVACAKEQDCWIATGGRRAWRWMGDGFVAGGPDQIVLAVVRDPEGAIYALHRGANEIDIHLSRIDGATWVPVPNAIVTTPGAAPEINFARFAQAGALWVGLRYRDGEETRAFGMAVIDTASGRVDYHREGGDDMLPIPMNVIDADVQGETAYFATSEGVARLSRGEVKRWDEPVTADARAVTIATNGNVIIATPRGAARWDGKAWDVPPALRFEINDVVATKNGQVWMATERGITAWDGHKLRRVDTRRGLAENHILDIATDQYDRLWARGLGSLTLISQ